MEYALLDTRNTFTYLTRFANGEDLMHNLITFVTVLGRRLSLDLTHISAAQVWIRLDASALEGMTVGVAMGSQSISQPLYSWELRLAFFHQKLCNIMIRAQLDKTNVVVG